MEKKISLGKIGKDWREVNICQAMELIFQSIGCKSEETREAIPPNYDVALVVSFENGLQVAFLSQWAGPLSEATPDFSSEDPEVYVRKIK